jgi:hypothetical protein
MDCGPCVHLKRRLFILKRYDLTQIRRQRNRLLVGTGMPVIMALPPLFPVVGNL